MGPKFDQTTIDATAERLSKIDDDKKPLWGVMTAPQMRSHLLTALRYSLGKEQESPPEGNFFVRRVATPLLLSGIMKLPKNIQRPKLYDAAAPTATVEELLAELREFYEQYQSSTFKPPPHPMLGDLGPTGWAKLHALHADHHLRQFGV